MILSSPCKQIVSVHVNLNAVAVGLVPIIGVGSLHRVRQLLGQCNSCPARCCCQIPRQKHPKDRAAQLLASSRNGTDMSSTRRHRSSSAVVSSSVKVTRAAPQRHPHSAFVHHKGHRCDHRIQCCCRRRQQPIKTQQERQERIPSLHR